MYNLIIVNLISPRIDYNSHSKSNINLEPFAKIFSNEFYKLCKSPNTKNKKTKKNNEDFINQRVKNHIYEERDAFKIAKGKLDVNSLDLWTQSTNFYTFRKKNPDIEDIDKKRKYITTIIKDVCWEIGEELRGKGNGFKRHELGIIAAERAQLYIDNQVLGVTFAQLEELTKKGTDLLVIEKEGVSDMLMDYANEKGVAILNTRGFLTEYAEDLTKLAREKGCNIATLTDWDSAGLTIASKLPKAYRVGIDEKTLEKLELSKEKVEENVQQEEKDDKHLTGLKKLSQEQIPSPYSKDEWDQMIEYLESRKRIEIDSVIAYVGHENFWNYIMKELDSIFSTRDYNRAIDIPEYVLPTLFDQFKEKVIDIVSEKQSPFIEKLSELYSNTSGFLDVKEEMKGNEKELRSFVDKDKEIKNRIIEAFKKVFLTE